MTDKKDLIQFINGLHKVVATSLFENGTIEFLSQVSIIEYNYDENINNYISVLTDVFDPYQFALYQPNISSTRETKQYIDDALRGFIVSDYDDRISEVQNEKLLGEKIRKLFDLLKMIKFQYPTTSSYVKKMIDTRRRTKYLHYEDINIVEDGQVLRDKYIEWKLGVQLEDFLLHRSDGPIYSNYFFSIDEKLYAVLIFVGGKHKESLMDLNGIIGEYFSNNNKINELTELINKWRENKPDINIISILDNIESMLKRKATNAAFSTGRTQSIIVNIRKEIDRVKGGINTSKASLLMEVYEKSKSPSVEELEDWWRKLKDSK